MEASFKPEILSVRRVCNDLPRRDCGTCKGGEVKATPGATFTPLEERVYSRSHLRFSYSCRRFLSWYFPRSTALMKGMSFWFEIGQKFDLLASTRSLTWTWAGNCCSLPGASWADDSFSLPGFSLNKGSSCALYGSKRVMS